MLCSQLSREIIHVFEPFVRLEAKVRESDLIDRNQNDVVSLLNQSFSG